MNKFKGTKALIVGVILTLMALLSSGYLISTTLSKLESFNETYKLYDNTYTNILNLKYHTEKLLTTTDIQKEIILWKDAQEDFRKSLDSLNKIASKQIANTQIIYFWNIIQKEFIIIEKKLSHKIMDKDNILEKSLLRKLGEEFFSNKDSESYIVISDLKNSLDYTKQYEEFLIDELNSLEDEQQKKISYKIIETKNNAILYLIIVVVSFLITMFFIARKIIITEKDLYFSKQELEDINQNLDKKVIEKTQQIVSTTDMLNEAQKIASIGSWRLDILENKLEWSDEIFNIFEIKKENFEPSYEFFLNSIHPEDIKMVDEVFKNSLKTKEPYDVIHRVRLKNGKTKYVRERGKNRFDKDGNAIFSSGTVQDITKEQNLKNELLKEKEQANQANRSKSDFLANMSHEIRTPLNAILGFVGLLKDECRDSIAYNYVCTIEDSGNSLLSIIEDILDLSKIENNKLEIEKIDFDINKELKTTVDIFRARAEEKQIKLTLNIEKDIPPYLKSDPLRLKQILSNLLSNAIKFTKQNKNIDIDISYCDNKLTISVKDQGVGIAEDKIENIFEAFSQEDTSTTRKYGGTGLGLTISSSLVKLLGGRLELKSKKGVGSEFYFTIPVDIGKSIKKEKEYSKDVAINKHILLVEDNITNQMFMKVLLKKLLITYEIANDGIEAIEIFKKNKFDLVLMDENMPNMNGIEATKHILDYEKENNLKHTPIVALTANAIKGEKERFLKAGMDEYLSKPLDKNKFIEILNKVYI